MESTLTPVLTSASMIHKERMTTLILSTTNDPNMQPFTLSDDKHIREVNYGANLKEVGNV